MKKILIVVAVFILFVNPEITKAIAPEISLEVEGGQVEQTGDFNVRASVEDDQLENYHFRVVKDGGSEGHTCLGPDALFDPLNQGYASTTLGKDACGFNYNSSVYTSVSFVDSIVASLNAVELASFGGFGDYWLILGARDSQGNRSASDYLLDPRVKVSINAIASTTGSSGTGGNTGTGSNTSQGTSGGGSGGSSGSRRRDISGITGSSSGGGQVLGASTCSEYITEYIKFGALNNPEEVKKLQLFLNKFFGLNNKVTGTYDQETLELVNKFQVDQYAGVLLPWDVAGLSTGGPTGYVYKTTRRWINILECPQLINSDPFPNRSFLQ